MKSKLEAPIQDHKFSTRLFMGAITYRIPFPVTKVIYYTSNVSFPICPRCSLSLDREYVSFCDRCGQKLNWDLFEYASIVQPNFQKNNF